MKSSPPEDQALDQQFSFLMCVHKNHQFLAPAIESVLKQTDRDFKFYIIANNCNDDLWQHLKSFRDDRIKLHRTLIGQLAFNLNYGLNLIERGYVLRMDADDLSLPDRLAVTKKRLHELDYPDALGGRAILIDSEGKKLGETRPLLSDAAIRRSLWKKNPFIHPSCALRVESIIGLGGYLGGFMSEDYDLWLRAARSSRIRLCNANDVFIEYRINQYQSRGNPLAYSEVAGCMLRETLMQNRHVSWGGVTLAILKRLIKSNNRATQAKIKGVT